MIGLVSGFSVCSASVVAAGDAADLRSNVASDSNIFVLNTLL